VPAVSLVLHGLGNRRVTIPGLLDSGADNSTFPLAWAKQLGIDKEQCEIGECNTVAGKTKQYVWPDGVEAQVQAMGKTIRLFAAFTEGLPVVVLGRHDFFAEFKVTFDQRACTYTLEPY
jgi:hypothetical protein